VKASVQKKALASVQQEKGLHEQAARELEQASRALSEKVRELEEAKKIAPPPAPPAPPSAPTLLPDRVPASPRKSSGRAPQPSGPMPNLPAGPPPTPVLPGIPAETFAPATRRPLPSVAIAFARDADQLPADAAATLQGLADRRGGGPVMVYAGGDSSSAAPAAQGSALALAMRRAGAISRALAVAGVPPAQTRTEATALGRYSGARLVD